MSRFFFLRYLAQVLFGFRDWSSYRFSLSRWSYRSATKGQIRYISELVFYFLEEHAFMIKNTLDLVVLLQPLPMVILYHSIRPFVDVQLVIFLLVVHEDHVPDRMRLLACTCHRIRTQESSEGTA
jgi:hypothetical protein